MPRQKYFLDTSVVRKSLDGTRKYRRYLDDQFSGGEQYVSSYIYMEYRRGFLETALSFYHQLQWQTIETVNDALSYWSNNFAKRDLAVVLLLGKGLKAQKIDLDSPRDKEKAILCLARLIRRYDALFRRTFKDSGIDSTKCARAKIGFASDLEDFDQAAKNFSRAFNDVQACSSKCSVKAFFKNKHVLSSRKLISEAPNVKKTSAKGFHESVDLLDEVMSSDKAIDCKLCAKLGDAVIAIESPKDMRLEHIDKSFNGFCQVLEKEHMQHPSEQALHKTLNDPT